MLTTTIPFSSFPITIYHFRVATQTKLFAWEITSRGHHLLATVPVVEVNHCVLCVCVCGFCYSWFALSASSHLGQSKASESGGTALRGKVGFKERQLTRQEKQKVGRKGCLRLQSFHSLTAHGLGPVQGKAQRLNMGNHQCQHLSDLSPSLSGGRFISHAAHGLL